MSCRSFRGVLIAAIAAAVFAGAGCGSGGTGVRTPPASPRSIPPAAVRRATTPSPSCTTAGVLATWSMRRLAEQTVVVPVNEDDVGSAAPEVAAGAGGVMLYGDQAPPGLKSSLAQLARDAPGGVPPFVMSDEEGGAVQRMANLAGSIPSAREMAATMTPTQIERLALQAGRRMKAAGVTMDLAPVLDLDGGEGPNAANPIGTRSFSPAEKTASADGLAFSAGLEAAGVVPVVKHFPGLGGVTANTDLTPASTLPWSNLRAGGLLPFTAAVRAGVPAVMVSNATVPGLTSLPASMSPAVITRVLRQQLGFSGLVLTDSLSAGALSDAGYSVPRASTDALAAGADMVLYNADATSVASLTSQTVRAIESAVRSGELSNDRLKNAVLHILDAKHIDLCE
jgi:beta-N-acetylhexosaminidase